MNYNENPNPNWTHFPANIDPLAEFELSDYLAFDDGVDQFNSLSPQSLVSSENFAAGGTRAASSTETGNMSGATSRNTNMQKNKMDQVGHRVAFRTKSELEVMDDGFKWRKYGKKSVKNSPNPRNYYKCSSGGCNVKKRVERDRDDSSYVITTYDGVHNHESPSVVYYNKMPLMAPNAWNLQASSHSHSSSSS
ncbi:WRKY domain containing protein [Parasponia andersonii]|uniref:WRKY domain containing protein n=1 Tax=Parasponia andersonii TaxID=3476 RepID=A0A2P5CCB6_PARAD|nr:WRKY domain containing protein [Parasponia andersonii]